MITNYGQWGFDWHYIALPSYVLHEASSCGASRARAKEALRYKYIYSCTTATFEQECLNMNYTIKDKELKMKR